MDLITTDGFYIRWLSCNKTIFYIKRFSSFLRYGAFSAFLADIKSGKPKVSAPVYSHLIYDIVPDQFDVVDQPDILILEGLNVLQTGDRSSQTFVSDFVDFLFMWMQMKIS